MQQNSPNNSPNSDARYRSRRLALPLCVEENMMITKAKVAKILVAVIAIVVFALQFLALFISMPELITVPPPESYFCKEYVQGVNQRYSSSITTFMALSSLLSIIIFALLPFVRLGKKHENT